MNIKIGEATVSDAYAISALVCSLTCEHIAPSLGERGLKTLLASMDVAFTTRRIADGWLHLIAFSGGELCGVIVIKWPLHYTSGL
jgi:hypothetical protein